MFLFYKYSLCTLVIWIATTSAVKDESKWVWSKNNNNNKQADAVTSLSVSSRLAAENDRAPEGRPLFLPANEGPFQRPLAPPLPPPPPNRGQYRPPPPVIENVGAESYRPPVYRPSTPILGGGPNRYPERPPSATTSPFRPPGKGVLTGPVPSWEQDRESQHRYQSYDTCKCVYGLNCKSPGIKFGHCDVDKQYCCYNEKGGARYEENSHSGRPLRGGPYDSAVLVGPGGPTGIIGRPPRPPSFDSYSRVNKN